ncbi:MAG TPA: HAD-IIIA family hydrolase [Bacteroidia bacterium]|nr:HAD-IIIA family hydrolase [Bacteroidia bacterium]HRH07848.1 HAD-IIIA family hydrolase [Bacteroidia bacterium]HRH64002.1 HAD-IIIA family hydrolase [Bacteroidia bacterium]
MSKNFKELLSGITTFIFDVDGVLTDGSVTLLPDGEQVRKMNIKDGFALQLAIKKGYRVAIISGGKSESIRTRMQGLGVTDVYLGIANKVEKFDDYLISENIKPEEVLYMGDDLPDFEVMKKVGVAVCPFDAAPEIVALSLYVSRHKGGEGCVRDVIEQTLRLHNKWFDVSGFVW